jgi:predicted nucleic acid-binding protein
MSARSTLAWERRVFVDSSAYLALLDRTDEHHAQAAAILDHLADVRTRPFTTNILVIEAYSLVLSALGRTAAVRFLLGSMTSSTVVVRARARDEERARQILLQYDDRDFSFVDAISFAVMERLHIARAFTFDRHFAQYGFTILAAPP